MRVAYIVSRFPSSSETFIARELNHVAAAGVEIDLWALYGAREQLVHPSAEPWIGRVRRPGRGEALAALAWWLLRAPLRTAGILATVLIRCGRSPGYGFRSLTTVPLACAIARQLRLDGVDRVHAHYATFPALAAWVSRRLAGIPYSVTVHAHDLFVTQAMLEDKVRDADFIDAISEFNREFLHSYGGETETPVHVIHCGLELERYPYRPRVPPENGRVEALCVASLQEHKGHRFLLEAMASGGSELERLRLTLVGAGPLRAELEKRSAGLGLADRVVFEGSLPEDEVRALLDRCHLFVLPSIVAADGQMEGLPVVLMESLACGVPTVASRLSGIPELIRDGETGYLANPGDPGNLAAALSKAIGGGLDPAAGRDLVEREFDITRSAAALVTLFGGGGGGRSV